MSWKANPPSLLEGHYCYDKYTDGCDFERKKPKNLAYLTVELRYWKRSLMSAPIMINVCSSCLQFSCSGFKLLPTKEGEDYPSFKELFILLSATIRQASLDGVVLQM